MSTTTVCHRSNTGAQTREWVDSACRRTAYSLCRTEKLTTISGKVRACSSVLKFSISSLDQGVVEKTLGGLYLVDVAQMPVDCEVIASAQHAWTARENAFSFKAPHPLTELASPMTNIGCNATLFADLTLCRMNLRQCSRRTLMNSASNSCSVYHAPPVSSFDGSSSYSMYTCARAPHRAGHCR